MKWMLLCGMALLIGGACSPIRVLSDYDRRADFSHYKTFALSEPRDVDPTDPLLNQLNQNRLRREITEQMELRGYNQSDDDPDLAVNIYVKITPYHEVYVVRDYYLPYRGYYRYYGHWGYYRYWGPGWTYMRDVVREYEEGTLIIDLVDTEEDQLVWHGVAVGILEELPSDPDVLIHQAVKTIFDQYPYVAGNGDSMISTTK
ncbi:MAG: DUF4136 domain-containing protein [Bacteroidota bacterium]